MTLLIIGLILFFAIHLLSSTPLRAGLANAMGEMPFKGLYALISLVGLGLIIAGKANAPFEPVWNAFPALRPVTLPVMWLSFVLLPAAHMKGNIKRVTRHPMLWGIVLWSVAHLAVNGDLASILLFGSFGLYSLYAMVSQTQRGATLQTEKVAYKYDLIVLAAGTVVFVAIWQLHGVLFGLAL